MIKKLYSIFAMCVLANSLISDSAQAGQVLLTSDNSVFASHAFSNNLLLNTSIPPHEGLENPISLIEGFSFPTQLVIARNINDDAKNAIVLLRYQQEPGLSPAWFYVMMIVILAIVLVWDDGHINKSR